jgi:hypothetical protein
MLAYVYWHSPATDALEAYETALGRFHHTLSASDIPGFMSSASFALDGVPWLSSSSVYADWYLVEDFGALGELNGAAVASVRRAEHDAAATRSALGVAGVYSLKAGDSELQTDTENWCDKPAAMSYVDLVESRRGATGLWQRQMVLGPTPEFCATSEARAGYGAVVVRRLRTIARSS